MNFAVSNIAWAFQERMEAYRLLNEFGFSGLEIAPGLLFPDVDNAFNPSSDKVKERISELELHGLQLVSMQSILFGVNGAALFGSPSEVKNLVDGVKRAIDLAHQLKIPNIVFGSPKQRIIPEGLTSAKAIHDAKEIFLRLGDYALKFGVSVALEPNPEVYGTNFMTTFGETLDIVQTISHPSITLNFDTGALFLTDQFDLIETFVEKGIEHISHVHVSSPNLDFAPSSMENAAIILGALRAHEYDKAVSIEMRAADEDRLTMLKAAVEMLSAVKKNDT